MSVTNHFTDTICEKLKNYVYRLIDPRDGSTFYVGRGRGNRVFSHAAGKQAPTTDEDTESLKLKTIREIRNAGLEVQHVIHRHGMDEATAKEVEAALIDAYAGLSNIQPGYDDGRGVMHASQVITEYEAPEAELKHKLLLITLNKSMVENHELLEVVRYAWNVNVNRAQKAEFVLAVLRGLIIGAFVADKWMAATPENFPEMQIRDGAHAPREGRSGFIGREAPTDIWKLYCQKRVPTSKRKPGNQNPIAYENI